MPIFLKLEVSLFPICCRKPHVRCGHGGEGQVQARRPRVCGPERAAGPTLVNRRPCPEGTLPSAPELVPGPLREPSRDTGGKARRHGRAPCVWEAPLRRTGRRRPRQPPRALSVSVRAPRGTSGRLPGAWGRPSGHPSPPGRTRASRHLALPRTAVSTLLGAGLPLGPLGPPSFPSGPTPPQLRGLVTAPGVPGRTATRARAVTSSAQGAARRSPRQRGSRTRTSSVNSRSRPCAATARPPRVPFSLAGSAPWGVSPALSRSWCHHLVDLSPGQGPSLPVCPARKRSGSPARAAGLWGRSPPQKASA